MRLHHNPGLHQAFHLDQCLDHILYHYQHKMVYCTAQITSSVFNNIKAIAPAKFNHVAIASQVKIAYSFNFV